MKQKCGLCSACQRCPQGAVSFERIRGFVTDQAKCIACGYCVDVCPSKAREICGQYTDVDQLVNKAWRDTAFYQASGGGITLGGGDPMLQSKAAIEMLQLSKEKGLNTALETAGNYEFESLAEAAEYCDTILFDIKGWGDSRHVSCTGVKPERIRNNLLALDRWITDHSRKLSLIVRIPLSPGYNFTPQEFSELAEWLTGLQNLEMVEILPLHHLGSNKYEQLGLTYPMGDPEQVKNVRRDEIDEYVNAIIEKGLNVIVAKA